jgi:hypothetical protein
VANALGLVGILFFIVCTVALAAAVTWVVVRLSPPPNPNKGGGLFARLMEQSAQQSQTRESGKRSSSGE